MLVAMVEVWVELDGDGWRWGVDQQERGRIVCTAEGGYRSATEPDPSTGGVRPGYEVTALLMVRQGLTRYDPANPPAVEPMPPLPAPEPTRPSPTLAERAKRGRQGSL